MAIVDNLCDSFQVIFGTGDSLKAITTTTNVAFTRAAASQVSVQQSC